MDSPFFIVGEVLKNIGCAIPFIREQKEKRSKRRKQLLEDDQRFYAVAEKYRREYEAYSSIEGKNVLEVGCGNSISTVLYMIAWGAKKVVLVDRFKHLFWDSYDIELHQKIIEKIIESSAPQKDIIQKAFKIASGGKVFLEREIIELVKADCAQLPFPDEQFDLVVSNAVLEHVHRPERVVFELARVSKPGAIGIHEIDLRDHFIKNEPLRLLKYSNFLWNLMTWNRTGYSNRLRITEWLNIFKRSFFVQKKLDLVNIFEDELVLKKNSFNYYRNYSLADLKVVVFLIILQRR